MSWSCCGPYIRQSLGGAEGAGLLASLPKVEAPASGCPPPQPGTSLVTVFGSLDVNSGLRSCLGPPGVRVAGAKGPELCHWASGSRVPTWAWSSGEMSHRLRPEPAEACMPGSPAIPMLMPHVCPCRWWAGEWQRCSSSCGPRGLSRRAVLCIRSVGLDEQSALEPPACEHLPRPPAETPCNRDVPCPATWAVGNWSQVSVRMGGGPLPAPLSIFGYREAETAFREPLLPGAMVGGRLGHSRSISCPQSLRDKDALARHGHKPWSPAGQGQRGLAEASATLTSSSGQGTLPCPSFSPPEPLILAPL